MYDKQENMNKLIFFNNYLSNKNVYIVFLVLLAKILFSSSTCVPSFNCSDFTPELSGSYCSDKIQLTLNTNIPSTWPRPAYIYQNNSNYINIFQSLARKIPLGRTMFRITVESFEKCSDGITPIYRNVCCVSASNTCSTINDENQYEVPINWHSGFNNKVTITAISYFFDIYAIYDGTTNIQIGQTTLLPSQKIVNCNAVSKHTEYQVFSRIENYGLCN